MKDFKGFYSSPATMRKFVLRTIMLNWLQGYDEINSGFVAYHWRKGNPEKPYRQYALFSKFVERAYMDARRSWVKDSNHDHFKKVRFEYLQPLYRLLIKQSDQVILAALDGQLCQKYR